MPLVPGPSWTSRPRFGPVYDSVSQVEDSQDTGGKARRELWPGTQTEGQPFAYIVPSKCQDVTGWQPQRHGRYRAFAPTPESCGILNWSATEYQVALSRLRSGLARCRSSHLSRSTSARSPRIPGNACAVITIRRDTQRPGVQILPPLPRKRYGSRVLGLPFSPRPCWGHEVRAVNGHGAAPNGRHLRGRKPKDGFGGPAFPACCLLPTAYSPSPSCPDGTYGLY